MIPTPKFWKVPLLKNITGNTEFVLLCCHVTKKLMLVIWFVTALSTKNCNFNYRLFGPGNLGKRAFDNFVASHKCNNYCHALGLKDVAGKFRPSNESNISL